MIEADIIGPKKRYLCDEEVFLECRDTSGVWPAWRAVFLPVPVGLCGAVCALAVGEGFLSALFVYVLASVSALIVYQCLFYLFPLTVRSSDVRYFRARSFGRLKNDVAHDVETTSVSGALSRQMGAQQPDPAASMLAHVLIGSLGGYGECRRVLAHVASPLASCCFGFPAWRTFNRWCTFIAAPTVV